MLVLLEQGFPVEVGVEHFLVHIQLLQHATGYYADVTQCLAVLGFQHQPVLIEFVLQALDRHLLNIHAQTGEDGVDVGMELVEGRFLFAAYPTLRSLVSGQPQAQMRLLRVGNQWFCIRPFLLAPFAVKVVAIAELIQFEVAVAAVGIAGDGLQSAEEQRLAQYAQVLTQRVHDLDAGVQRQVLQRLVVRYLGQRVVEYLVESLCGQLLGDAALQGHGVGFLTVGQAGVQFLGELHVVISVDTQNVLHDVALALYVHAVARYFNFQFSIFHFLNDLDLKSVEYGLYGLLADGFTDEAVDTLDIDGHRPRLERTRMVELLAFLVRRKHYMVLTVHSHFAAGHFLNQQGGTFHDIDGVIGVAAALVAEGRIGLQLMPTAGLADGHRVEVGALEEDVLRLLGHAAVQTAEDAGDAHGLVRVGYHQVVLVHRALYAVQRGEFLACLGVPNMYLLTFDLVGIKGVERLAHLMQHEIGHIHYVVNRTQADGGQRVLQPLGRLLDGHTLDADARVTRTSLRGFQHDFNRQQVGGELVVERTHVGFGQGDVLSMCLVIRIQVACYAVVRCGIGSVRRDIHLNDRVVLDMIVVGGFHAHRRVRRQHDDAGVVGADAYLILGANHAERVLAT